MENGATAARASTAGRAGGRLRQSTHLHGAVEPEGPLPPSDRSFSFRHHLSPAAADTRRHHISCRVERPYGGRGLADVDRVDERGRARADARVRRCTGGEGWAVTRIPVDGGRVNLLATSGGGPYVTLSTHLDTVPPFIPPRRDATDLVWPRLVRRQGNRRVDAVRGGAPARERHRRRDAVRRGRGDDARRRARGERLGARERLPSSRARERRADREHARARHKGRDAGHRPHDGEAAHSAYPHLGRSATRALVHLLAELDTTRDAERPAARRDDGQHRKPRRRRRGQRRSAECRGATHGAAGHAGG